MGPSVSSAAATDVHSLNLAWLLRLRLVATAGQVGAIVVVHALMGIALPLLPIGTILLVAVLLNLAVAIWLRRRVRVGESVVGGLIAADVVLFSGLLYFTGGPANPFSFLYLVYIALATLALRPVWTWTLVALAVGCFGLLFVGHVPLAAVSHHAPPAGAQAPEPARVDHARHTPAEHAAHLARARAEEERRSRGATTEVTHADAMDLHLYGMWVAFGIGAAAIVYFLTRVTHALADREADLLAAREVARKTEKLASLATLAAGAAHELATPLATIAVVAKELERSLAGDADRASDVRLVREQVERCREILRSMAADSGQTLGELVADVSVATVLEAAIAGLPDAARVRLEAPPQQPIVAAPVEGLARAVRGLVANALDASREDAVVVLRARQQGTSCRIEVHDEGQGMAPDVLARAGEPFFTTKEPGRGMGLGLFLARALVERLGGSFVIESRVGHGTTAAMVLPCKGAA